MKSLERWLQEESPVVWELRGCYNEARLLTGLLQNENVYIGREGWMFSSRFGRLVRSQIPSATAIASSSESTA